MALVEDGRGRPPAHIRGSLLLFLRGVSRQVRYSPHSPHPAPGSNRTDPAATSSSAQYTIDLQFRFLQAGCKYLRALSRVSGLKSLASHHIAYMLLLTFFVIPRNFSSIFGLCSILELPTFLLAAGSLNPAFRNDYVRRPVLPLLLCSADAPRRSSQ